jgi:hypothetical protein
MDRNNVNYALQKGYEWISNFVSLEVVGRLGSILLVTGHFLSLFYEVWMQEACKFVCVFAQHSLFFLLDYSNSPQLDQSLLFDLALLLLLGLPVLLQLYLPQSLHFSPVLLFLHALFLSRHLVQLFLLCQSFQHFESELLLEISLFLFLLLFQFSLLPFCLLQHPPELFSLLSLLFLFL